MDKKSRGKAHWALGKAAALLQQAKELESDRSGDWRAWRRRESVAERLRADAARFEFIAEQIACEEYYAA